MLKNSNVIFSVHGKVLRWRILKSFLVVLLSLQVSFAYALPTGAHFKLCIGYDGHIDISLDDCDTGSTQPIQPSVAAAHTDNHHGDCLDIDMGCVSFDKLRPTLAEVCISSEMAKVNSAISVDGNVVDLSSRPLSQYQNHDCFHRESDTFPGQLTDYLRTTILLI